MRGIHVLHEHDAWATPLFGALEDRGLPYESWHLAQGWVDPAALPPAAVEGAAL